MNRRQILSLLAAGLLARPRHVNAQTPGRAGAVAPGPAEAPEKLDQYGGYKDVSVPGGATGYFRLGKLGSRSLLATPEGNAFWLRAVYSIDITDGGWQVQQGLQRKYSTQAGIPWQPWVRDVVQRMRQWGFNAIGEYSSEYAFPVESYYRGWSNPEKMPFIRIVNCSLWAKGRGVQNVFDIDYGRFPTVHHGEMRDVFDPRFESASREVATDSRSDVKVFTPKPLTNSPWLIGTTIDDADYTRGIKSAGHEHVGWLVAVGRPNHSKGALRDMLKRKYSTIDALNSAWGSTYTTWESDGSWPNGRGFLDESGRGRWLGTDAWFVRSAQPQVRADLFSFLEIFADRYFSTTAKACRAYTPNQLVFGPAALGVGNHDEVLRAAGRHLDAIQIGWPRRGELWPLIDKAYALSGKPMFVWTTFLSQRDSPFKNKPADQWYEDYPTQAERGAAYDGYVRRLATTPGIIGLDWWAWMDKITGGEYANFGLVNTSDEPYEVFTAAVQRTNRAIGSILKQTAKP